MIADRVIQVRSVTKQYPTVTALDDINIEIFKGEIFIILGPNGAGKTTLIEILEGIIAQTKGEVRLFGLPPSSDEVKQRIGVQTETGAFEKELRVRELLELYGSFYRKNAEIEPILEKLFLKEQLNSFFGDLSKGMKQKIAIAVALINDPDLIFLDEVTNGLDVVSRNEIWDILDDLSSQGKTIILTTHDMQEASVLGDRILFLAKGKIRRNDSLDNILAGFPARYKVEYSGEAYAGNHIVGLCSRGNKHTIFTNSPQDVLKDVRTLSEGGAVSSEVTLEDIYLHDLKEVSLR